jgi:hypothetical protein
MKLRWEEVLSVGTQQMQFEKATAQTLIVEIFKQLNNIKTPLLHWRCLLSLSSIIKSR